MTKVGSSPPSASTLATRLVVVVLPCVPAIAMPCFRRISSASIMRARHHRDLVRARRRDFRIVVLDRRRNDHGIGRRDVFRGMAAVAIRAPRLPAAASPHCRQVGAADLEAEIEQHLGDAAHAGAADADEVHCV